MDVIINETKVDIDLDDLSKEEILKKVREELEDEIIDRIYLDEVEVSLDYFRENSIKLDKLDRVVFLTKKNEILVEETLLQAKEYLPNLKNALIKSAKLYESKNINEASEKLNQCLDGIEWYTDAMSGIYNLIDEEDISEEGKEILDKLNKANTRAMVAMQNENYDYLSDIIEVEIVEYLMNLNELNNKLLEK